MKDRWEERDKQKDADVIWQAEYKVGDIHMALQSKGQSSLLCDNHVVLNVILYIKKNHISSKKTWSHVWKVTKQNRMWNKYI